MIIFCNFPRPLLGTEASCEVRRWKSISRRLNSFFFHHQRRVLFFHRGWWYLIILEFNPPSRLSERWKCSAIYVWQRMKSDIDSTKLWLIDLTKNLTSTMQRDKIQINAWCLYEFMAAKRVYPKRSLGVTVLMYYVRISELSEVPRIWHDSGLHETRSFWCKRLSTPLSHTNIGSISITNRYESRRQREFYIPS